MRIRTRELPYYLAASYPFRNEHVRGRWLVNTRGDSRHSEIQADAPWTSAINVAFARSNV